MGSSQCRCHGCRKIDTSKDARKKEAIGYYRIESAIALFCALLINIFVVSVFARGFYGKVSALEQPHPRLEAAFESLLLALSLGAASVDRWDAIHGCHAWLRGMWT